MGIGIVEKNTIRTFSYSTAVQEITLSGLMLFNNRRLQVFLKSKNKCKEL